MTPEERVSHYNQYNTYRGALQRQIDDWNASGGSKQKQPCGPPPNGPFGTFTLLIAEYVKDKSLDDAAGMFEIKADGKTTFLGREWSWKPHWPDLPEIPESQGPPIFGPLPVPVPVLVP